MSPLYAIHKLREETKRELSLATSPIIRSALSLQLDALTRRENSIRVHITLCRSAVTHTPAPTRCAFNFTSAPHLAPTTHWSFDEVEAARCKAFNRTHRKLEELFGPTPRPLATAIHSMGGVKKCLTSLNLDVFLTLPSETRRLLSPRILSTIHQAIIK
jgi:hypothetical protein